MNIPLANLISNQKRLDGPRTVRTVVARERDPDQPAVVICGAYCCGAVVSVARRLSCSILKSSSFM